jgi:hypothetical protein
MQLVPVLYHRESAGWWAESPTIAGWSATASTLDELRSLVEQGVRFALNSDEVVVTHMLAPGVGPPGLRFDFIEHEVVVIGRAGEAQNADPALQVAATS